MFVASATDFAIAQAIVSGTIRVTLRQSRLGGQFAAIEDSVSVIEAHEDSQQANDRIKAVRERITERRR